MILCRSSTTGNARNLYKTNSSHIQHGRGFRNSYHIGDHEIGNLLIGLGAEQSAGGQDPDQNVVFINYIKVDDLLAQFLSADCLQGLLHSEVFPQLGKVLPRYVHYRLVYVPYFLFYCHLLFLGSTGCSDQSPSETQCRKSQAGLKKPGNGNDGNGASCRNRFCLRK